MLTRTQLAQYTITGLMAWFAAAMTVRFFGDWLAGGAAATIYLLTLPVIWASVVTLQRLLSATAGELVAGVSIGTAAAAFCDGVALRWFPELYGPHSAAGGAWILWGAAAFLSSSFLTPGRRRR
jgi:hypothetical protein